MDGLALPDGLLLAEFALDALRADVEDAQQAPGPERALLALRLRLLIGIEGLVGFERQPNGLAPEGRVTHGRLRPGHLEGGDDPAGLDVRLQPFLQVGAR